MTEEPTLLDGRWLCVARGVVSEEWPELHDEPTWFLRWPLAEEDALWVVPKGERAYVQFGVVDIADTVDLNWESGRVTVPDPSTVEVRNIVPIDRELTEQDRRRGFKEMIAALHSEALQELEADDEGHDDEQ